LGSQGLVEDVRGLQGEFSGSGEGFLGVDAGTCADILSGVRGAVLVAYSLV
jgi:hypothetical protein